MTDADEPIDFLAAARAEVFHKGPDCTIARILEKLPPESAATLERAFEDTDITTAAIGRALKKNGYIIDDKTVARHRRAECLCAKAAA